LAHSRHYYAINSVFETCPSGFKMADLTHELLSDILGQLLCDQSGPRVDWQLTQAVADGEIPAGNPRGDRLIMKEQPAVQPLVFVVDDDASLREALHSLFRSVGLRAEMFGSAAEFLKYKIPDNPACLVLDVRLPGLSGLDFQSELAKANIHIPIIFITGHGDIPMTVRAMKAGAVEFLTKPIREQDLLDAVQIALDRDRARRAQDEAIYSVKAKYESLTLREQEVIGYVTAGLMNKQVAAKLDVSEITVKVHRGSVMKKMGARSLAELVRMADMVGIRRAGQ
jgi:FixJ family two-component response regulator